MIHKFKRRVLYLFGLNYLCSRLLRDELHFVVDVWFFTPEFGNGFLLVISFNYILDYFGLLQKEWKMGLEN